MISVVVQAGGRSSRMGQDKALVSLAGRPMIEHVLTRLTGLGDELLITSNNPDELDYLGVPIFTDEEPGAGALPGLRTALAAANEERVLVVACDMPFVNRLLLEELLARSATADVLVPVWKERYQTMHAVYRRKSCLPAVQKALDEGDRRMISFYPEVDVRPMPAEEIAEIDPGGLSFFNVNTPEDLAEAERILARSRS